MRRSVRSRPLAGWLLSTTFALVFPCVAGAAPNIVLILADDFGVGDIQAHYPDNKIRTPHLDRLVRQGLSFTDAHSPSSVCSPTRYGLLTGRYCWRTRLQEWVIAAYEPPLISPQRPTLPGFLVRHGYRTACVGKWHLGWEWPGPQPSRMTAVPNGQKNLSWDFTRPIRSGPTERGFDYYFGVDLPNLPPFTYIENDRAVEAPTAKYTPDPDSHVVVPPRGFAGAPMAEGWKFDKILPELTRRAVQQVHELAATDTPFFLFFSMTSPHEPVAPSQRFRGASGIAPIADFVMETDWSAGQVIQAVSDAGIEDDTIVIFTADNGHSHYTGWEQLVAAGHAPSGLYRGHKGDIWEGGHRVPLVVRWPGKTNGGTSSDQLVSLTDVFATCAEILGADLPADGAEDSISFLNQILPTGNPTRTSLVSHSVHGEFAYRDEQWKLVFKMAGENRQEARGQPTLPELYRLDRDIAEQQDLAAEHPQVVRQLSDRFAELVARGASRPNVRTANDTHVRFDVLQTERWAPAAE